jgi:hypothetical protein
MKRVMVLALAIVLIGIVWSPAFCSVGKKYIFEYQTGQDVPDKATYEKYRKMVDEHKDIPVGYTLEFAIISSADETGPAPRNNELSAKRGEWAKEFIRMNFAGIPKDNIKLLPLGSINNAKTVEVSVQLVKSPKISALPPKKENSVLGTIFILFFGVSIFLLSLAMISLIIPQRRKKSDHSKKQLIDAKVHVEVDGVDTVFILHDVLKLAKDKFIYSIRPELNQGNGLDWVKLIANLRNDLKRHYRKANDQDYKRSPVCEIINAKLDNKILEKENEELSRRAS